MAQNARALAEKTVLVPPAMTRCECAGITFEEIRRLIEEEGWPLEEVSLRTRCGRTCSACVPDLLAYLART